MSHGNQRGRRARSRGVLTLLALGALSVSAPRPAQAQFAVIDVAAIQQLIVQVRYWKEQIEAMTAHLDQLKKQYDAFTGARGMEKLVPITVAARNYLPSDWQGVFEVLQGISAEYGPLAADVKALIAQSAVLPDAVLGELLPAHALLLESGRKLAATAQALSREAYGESSLRFAQIEALRVAIATAKDPKAIAELSARIATEQAMLANDQVKLEALRQIGEAEARAQAQQVIERSVQGIGSVRDLPVVEY